MLAADLGTDFCKLSPAFYSCNLETSCLPWPSEEVLSAQAYLLRSGIEGISLPAVVAQMRTGPIASRLNTWSPVGGTLWLFRRCGLIGGDVPLGMI